jgi:hypothetical protein
MSQSEESFARAEKAIQDLRDERAKLQALIVEAHEVAQELLLASRMAKEEIRSLVRGEARKHLSSQLARLVEQLRVKE